MGGKSSLGRALALFAMAVVVCGGLVVTPPAAAQGDLRVVWPTVTKFNPDTTEYVIDVRYTGGGHLFLVHAGFVGKYTVDPVSPGMVTTEFPNDARGTRWITIGACPTDIWDAATCTETKTSPSLTVYSGYVASLDESEAEGPGSYLGLKLEPAGGSTVEVDWVVTPKDAPDGTPLISGHAADVPASGPLPAIGHTDALAHEGEYLYQATIRGTVDPYGSLEARVSKPFRWDSAIEVSGFRFELRDSFLDKTFDDVDVFYPAEDRFYAWRDYVVITLETEADGHDVVRGADITITDPAGAVVWTSDHLREWRGVDLDFEPVPAGVYTVTVRAYDGFGNEKTFSRPLRVSRKRLVWARWETTTSARASLIDRSVGRCASLRFPARPTWRNSIGYRSSAVGRRCRTLTSQSASTIHAIDLPRSPFGMYKRYDDIKISTYGGAPRRADKSYLVQWHWAGDRGWIARSQLDRRVRLHPGPNLGPRVVHGDPAKEDPYLIWSVGLAEGAQFDVKSFTVRAWYWDVR